jgi:hypothetical protein
MKAEIDEYGNIKINIIDLIDQLDDEQKQEIAGHFAWHSPIWNELVRAVADEYAAENFNSNIYKMRLAFFQSADVPRTLRQTIKALLTTILHLQQSVRVYTNANGQWRQWFHEHHPGKGDPVPFPRRELGWPDNKEISDFMQKTGIDGLLDRCEKEKTC